MPWFGKSRSDVPSAWAAALEQVLKVADPTRKVAEFVLTGQHVEALKTVKSGHPWVQGIGRQNNGAAKKAVATLYAGFGDVDAAVLRRWGKVLDASLGAQLWGLTLGDVAGCHWPHVAPSWSSSSSLRAMRSRKPWSLTPPCPARTFASSRALSAASM